jgi:hypothetical protein
MNNETFKKVIEKLDNTFDSHQLIDKWMVLNEKEYVELLCSHIESKNGIFRATHAEIGRYLADHAAALNIRKTERVSSENIKGYDNENQNWEKL